MASDSLIGVLELKENQNQNQNQQSTLQTRPQIPLSALWGSAAARSARRARFSRHSVLQRKPLYFRIGSVERNPKLPGSE